MLDEDLAALYKVEVKALNQAVKRNKERFPADFMFRLNQQEGRSLRSQSVTARSARGGRRSLPYAFTEQGVAMLSSVLRSGRAVHVNIQIMRAFVRLRRTLAAHTDIARKDRSARAEIRFAVSSGVSGDSRADDACTSRQKTDRIPPRVEFAHAECRHQPRVRRG